MTVKEEILKTPALLSTFCHCSGYNSGIVDVHSLPESVFEDWAKTRAIVDLSEYIAFVEKQNEKLKETIRELAVNGKRRSN